MQDSSTPDEKPKRKVAKSVVTPKRQYFVPKHGISVEASDVDEAVELAEKHQLTKEEDGDV